MGYGTVVLKVGGSIITDRSANSPQPDRDGMQRTADEVSSFDGRLVLVHGAGSYGHPEADGTDLWTGITSDNDRQEFARIQRLQNKLNCLYTAHLQEAGVPAFPMQPSAAAETAGGELDRFETGIIEALLGQGVVPTLFGVPAHDRVSDAAVLSGDVLAAAAADAVDADIVLHATDVDGVYDGDPAAEAATRLDEVTAFDPSMFTIPDRADASGGMANKVRTLFEYGQEGRIFSGKQPGTLRDALDGDAVETLITGGD